jgi:hypothetical protein
MCHGFISRCKENLISLILEGLSIISFEQDDDGDDWGHALSASCCLQKLSILIGNDVLG